MSAHNKSLRADDDDDQHRTVCAQQSARLVFNSNYCVVLLIPSYRLFLCFFFFLLLFCSLRSFISINVCVSFEYCIVIVLLLADTSACCCRCSSFIAGYDSQLTDILHNYPSPNSVPCDWILCFSVEKNREKKNLFLEWFLEQRWNDRNRDGIELLNVFSWLLRRFWKYF